MKQNLPLIALLYGSLISLFAQGMENDKTKQLRYEHQCKLIAAIQKQDEEKVQLLVAQRGDINKIDETGKTPLDYAQQTNNNSLVNALIKASEGDLVKTPFWYRFLTPLPASNKPFEVTDC